VNLTFLAPLLRVVAVLAVAAGAAGSIYGLVHVARDTSDESSHLVVAATPTATPVAEATPTPTFVPGLTPTGYTALDGTPLYQECIQPGLPLPPTYPTPIGPAIIPTPAADLNPNPTPRPEDIPSFDVMAVQPSDSSGWPVYTSECFGFSFPHPPDWQVLQPFELWGYKQTWGGSFVSPDGLLKVEIDYTYTPADLFASRRAVPAGNREYQLVRNAPVTVDGRPGLLTYSSSTWYLDRPRVALIYLISAPNDWYFGVLAIFDRPYQEKHVADVFALVEGIRFRQ
jgi:hypothetical protein